MHNLTDFLGKIPLTGSTPEHITWALLALLLLTGLLISFHKHTFRRTLSGIFLSAILCFIAWFTMEVWPNPFPGEVPPRIFSAAFVPVFLLFCLLTTHKKRMVFTVLTALGIACTYLATNQAYQQFLTPASFFPGTHAAEVSYSEFQAMEAPPERDGREIGALVTLPMHDAASHLVARDALAYIPPAYWKHPQLDLPVMVLLSGNPGSPRLWFTAGEATSTLDTYQKEHGGISPIVISVDGTGSMFGNPACVDSRYGRVQTFLARDIPTLIKEKIRVNEDQSAWSIGGLSYGGTCALTVFANHPTAYGMFLDFSGEKEPNAGTREETVAKFFDGDLNAYLAVTPIEIFKKAATDKTDVFTGTEGWFVYGDEETATSEILKEQAKLAQQAGVAINVHTVAGAHTYQTWREAFRFTLDYVAQRGGLA